MPQLTKVVTTLFTGLGNPKHLCFDAAGRNLWYTNPSTGKISQFDTQASTLTGNWFGTGTAGTANGANGTGQVSSPAHLCTDGTYVYWLETANNKIRRAKISDRSIEDFAGSVTAGSADGTGVAATFQTMSALAINTAKTKLYVAQSTSVRVIDIATVAVTTLPATLLGGSGALIVDTADTYLYGQAGFKIWRLMLTNGSPFQTYLAGSGVSTADLDGLGRSGQLRDASQMAIDADFLYFSETTGHTVRQMSLDVNNSVPDLQTVAGTNTAGTADGTGTAAGFNSCQGVAFWPGQAVPTLVVSDYNGNKFRKIV